MAGYDGHKVPAETVQEIINAGLMRAATPAKWGGYEGLDMGAAIQVIYELARADMSTAWCYSVWTSHNWVLGGLPMKTQEEYFADGPDVVCSTSSIPDYDSATYTDDGYLISGR